MQHLISNLGEMAYSTLNSSQPRFNNYTRANCGIPMTPLPLPGRKSSEYDHTPSRYAGIKIEEHLIDDHTEHEYASNFAPLLMSSTDQEATEARIPLSTDVEIRLKIKKASNENLNIVDDNPPKSTQKPNEVISVSDSNIFKQLADGQSLASIKAKVEKELKRIKQDLKIINLLFAAEQSNTDEASVQDLTKRFIALEKEMALIKKRIAAKSATDNDREANNTDADNEESNAGNKSGKPDDDDAEEDDEDEPVKPVTTKTNSGKVPVKAGSAPKKVPAQTSKKGPAATKKGPAATTKKGPVATTKKGPAPTTKKGPAPTKKGPAATTKKVTVTTTKKVPAVAKKVPAPATTKKAP